MSMTPGKIKWSVESTCKLIQLYKHNSLLWDPKNGDYKNRCKKSDAMEKIANLFEVSADEVDRKIRNLCSQYLRERRKYKKWLKIRPAKRFQSKWYGYSLLRFLPDTSWRKRAIRAEIQQAIDNSEGQEESNQSNDAWHPFDLVETKTEIIENADVDTEQNGMYGSLNNEEIGILNVVSKPVNNRQQQIRTTNVIVCDTDSHLDQDEMYENSNDEEIEMFSIPVNNQQQIQTKAQAKPVNINIEKRGNKIIPTKTDEASTEGAYKVLKSLCKDRQEREETRPDDFDVFGDMVARKLRKFRSRYARCTVQHLVNNILYEAELGKYDDPPTNTNFRTNITPFICVSPPSSTSSTVTSYSNVPSM